MTPLMLVIRGEQMEAFRGARWKEFAVTAERHCRVRHPQICSQLSDEVIQTRVNGGILQARSHGFERAADVIRYLDFLFVTGPNAGKEPWAAAILGQTKYSAATRMDLIFRTLGMEERDAEPEIPARELPDATWPQPARQPVPPAPVLEPPGESCLLRPPCETHDNDRSMPADSHGVLD